MEHFYKIIEVVLALFGSMKFLHECFEVAVHVYKLARRFK